MTGNMNKYVCLVDFVKGIMTKMFFFGGGGMVTFFLLYFETYNYTTNANYKCMLYE